MSKENAKSNSGGDRRSNTKNRNSHVPVLLRETIEGLGLVPGATVIDATLGSGGHFSAILQRLGHEGTVLGIDIDKTAITRVREQVRVRIANEEAYRARVLFAIGNFRDIAKIAKAQGLETVDAIVADLGWRIEQFSSNADTGGSKGFSFTANEPLQMTFGDPADYPFTAADIVSSWREEDIATILKGYGEERYARLIAHAIVESREKGAIKTAAELAAIVSDAVPGKYRRGRIHPATKTFQALRIAVNDEIDALKEFIEGASGLLSHGGRLAIISFHSIEDRIVKHAMRQLAETGSVKRVTKKPIMPRDEEIQSNPRARSAKLRIIEKIEKKI
jgi:16S rRNA (cytosine1402-N4)-methyltransferase